MNDYLAGNHEGKLPDDDPAVVEAVASVKDRVNKLLAVKGERTVDSFHKELGQIMWEYCGMARSEEGLKTAIDKIRVLRDEVLEERQGDRCQRGSEPDPRARRSRG